MIHYRHRRTCGALVGTRPPPPAALTRSAEEAGAAAEGEIPTNDDASPPRGRAGKSERGGGPPRDRAADAVDPNRWIQAQASGRDERTQPAIRVQTPMPKDQNNRSWDGNPDSWDKISTHPSRKMEVAACLKFGCQSGAILTARPQFAGRCPAEVKHQMTGTRGVLDGAGPRPSVQTTTTSGL